MPIEFVMPKFGLTMQDANIVRWLKKEGESIAAGQPVLEIETEKITCEVEAPISGVLSKIVKQEGTTALVGAVIALIEPS